MTDIKICGITNENDALAAVEAGADYLGLIFVEASPRSITPKHAVGVAETIKHTAKRPVKLVGVFQNHPIEEVNRITRLVGLDLAQLHGHESPEDCQTIQVPVIKVLVMNSALTEAELLAQLERYQPSEESNIVSLLIDLPKQAVSGSPTSIASAELPASVLKRLKSIYWLAAGGLNPDNVQDAIRQFTPNGVDVASGIESKPGRKDLARMQRFCDTVRATQVITESLGELPSCNH